MNISINVDHQLLVDLLVTAVEGGSNYWADFIYPHPRGSNSDKIRLIEDEPSNESGVCFDREVSADDLLVGLQRLAESDLSNFPAAHAHLLDVLSDNYDADTADVVLQMTVFGELVYG